MALSKDIREYERVLLQHASLSEKKRHLPERRPVCPAAMEVDGHTFVCRIDNRKVIAYEQPTTFYGRCSCPDYAGCPTWVAVNKHRG